ncbi:MAG: 3-deoxy-8-phosphooctulonate synthase [Planctomycetota bacterium]|nr:3-deoxy-8-phosphooctulonate synthase [Planctomycetota bacterium]
MNAQGRLCRIPGPDNQSFRVGDGQPLCVIAGPCVIEDRELMFSVARTLRDACAASGLGYVFKASFDKANRTSADSSRGPGISAGLDLLAEIRESEGVPVTTDIHEAWQAEKVAEVVDIIQIPAFLCRQTDLLVAAGEAAGRRGRSVNVKKGQFISPAEMKGPVGKLVAAGCGDIMVTERGTFFGYHRLVNDFIGIGDMLEARYHADVRPPVCFDATHSAQLPGLGATSGGRRERVPLLARAAAAAGVDALFLECHPEPERARSDASTMLALSDAAPLLRQVAAIAALVRKT